MTPLFFSREPAFEAKEFIGRTKMLKWIEARLGSITPQNINLVGEPRIGKTSTLYQVYQQQLGLHPTEKGLYVWMPLTALPMHNSLAFWREILSKLETTYNSDTVKSDVDDFDDTLALDAEDTFELFRERLQQLLEGEGYDKVIFLIDDFDVVISGLNAHDLDWLRSIATGLRESVAFVITSTDPLRQVTLDLQRHSISPFHNVFSSRRLTLLSLQESEMLVRAATEVLSDSPLSVQHQAYLIEEAGRHPDLLRIISEYFAYTREETEGQIADTALVNAVRTEFRYDSHVLWLYEQLLERRTTAQKQALFDLAQGTPNDDALLFNHLELHLGLVQQKNGDHVPFSDSFRAWLVQQAGTTSAPALAVREQTTPHHPASSAPTLYFDADKRQVLIGDRVPIRPTKLEFRIIAYMISRAGEVCTHEDLLQHIWGRNRNKAVVEKAMNRLRSKLEPDVAIPQYIVSVRGQGYILQNSEIMATQE